MKLSNQQPIKPSFKAKVIIAPKETIVKEAGNYCAEQLEKVIPTIKKIAEKEKNIDEILINPIIRKDSNLIVICHFLIFIVILKF